MKSMLTKPIQAVAYCLALGVLAATVAAFAQDQGNPPPPSSAPSSPPPSAAPSPGWHSFSNPPEGQANQPQANDPQGSYPQGSYPQGRYPQGNYPPTNAPQGNYPPNQPVPSRLRLQAGTFVTVRIDQMLSSDKNQVGDGFSATLIRPLVADGVVVAQRGQLIAGRVSEVQKAGRVKGVSRLGVQLTDLTLVDGQQVPIETELSNMNGPTSNGRDAAAIAGTTITGAAIGAAADLGPGAAIGAGAGLIAGTVGVLLTRGRPTVIYPESLLTFRLAEPVAISTDRAPQAFHYVGAAGYGGAPAGQNSPPPRSGWNCLGYGWPPPYQAPPYYYYPYYPYPWGVGVGLWWGPGFYGRGFYGRGFYHR